MWEYSQRTHLMQSWSSARQCPWTAPVFTVYKKGTGGSLRNKDHHCPYSLQTTYWYTALERHRLSPWKCKTLHWLFGTFLLFAACALFSILLREVEGSIEPSSSISYFSRLLLLLLLPGRSRRTLVSADALGRFLRSNPNWKRFMWMTEVPRKLTVKTHHDISSAPCHWAQMVSKGEARGRHLDREGWFTVIDLYHAS